MDCLFFLRFAGTNIREFGFQTLPLGMNFCGSKETSGPVFALWYLYIDVIELV